MSAALKNANSQTYIACEDLDFIWTEEEVFDFQCQWADGVTLEDLVQYFGRTQEEILILALDLGLKGKVRPRKGGLIGMSREVTIWELNKNWIMT